MGKDPGKGVEVEKKGTEKDRKREERERREHGVLGAERSNSPFIESQAPNWLLLGNCWAEPQGNANKVSLLARSSGNIGKHIKIWGA